MTILLENVYKIYDGIQVPAKLYTSIEWDKCYAFVGPEGSGKSTVLKMFMGLEKPDSGEVHRMGDYKYDTLHSAYVPQEGSLNPKKDAVWNVKKAHRWANKKSAIKELSKLMPVERQSVVAGELKEYERRFVEIVKALMVPADFIVLDEPFVGMNTEQKNLALDYVLKQRGSRPLLIATRNEDEAELKFANKVIHL